MDWGIVSQATFFLGIALLAIVVTIFVFASSLLGRAVEAHRDDQEKLRKEKEELLTQRREKLQKQLKESVTAEDMKRLREEIEKLEAEIAKFKKKSESIKKSYEVFGVKGGVVYPALCFLTSSILSGLAWSFAQAWLGFYLGSSFIPSTPVLWLLALLAMGCGIDRLYLSLIKIQEIAVTSEEAALRRTIEALKISQKELDEEKRPELELIFLDKQPPFHVKRGMDFTIKFQVGLAKGELARKASVWLIVPKQFTLLGRESKLQQADDLYPGCVATEFEIGDILAQMLSRPTLSLKVPSLGEFPHEFVLNYRLVCERWAGEMGRFKVVVE